MPLFNMKYYYTYLIICTEGSFCGKVYFGKHTTSKLKDGYIGSGKLLKDYLNKYPDGYYKEIISFYNSQEELSEAEFELIKPHLGKDYCLNQKDGGIGKWPVFKGEKNGMYGRKHSIESRLKMQENHKGQIPWNKGKKLTPLTEEQKQKLSKTFKGRKLSEEWKRKIGEKSKGRKHSEESKRHMSESKMGNKYCLGRVLSNSTKNKIGQANSNKHRVYDNIEHTKWHMENNDKI